MRKTEEPSFPPSLVRYPKHAKAPTAAKAAALAKQAERAETEGEARGRAMLRPAGARWCEREELRKEWEALCNSRIHSARHALPPLRLCLRAVKTAKMQSVLRRQSVTKGDALSADMFKRFPQNQQSYPHITRLWGFACE